MLGKRRETRTRAVGQRKRCVCKHLRSCELFKYNLFEMYAIYQIFKIHSNITPVNLINNQDGDSCLKSPHGPDEIS